MTEVRTSPSGPIVEVDDQITTDDVLNVSQMLPNPGTLTEVLDSLILPEETAAARATGTGDGPPVPQTISEMLDWLNGAAWLFNGTSNNANIGNNLSFERTQSFSIGLWFNTNQARRQDLLAKDDPTAEARGYATFIDEVGQLFFNLCSDNVPVGTNLLSVRTAGNWADGQEHFVLFTYGGTSNPAGVTIYVDGVSQALTTVVNTLTGTTLSSAQLVIGAALNATVQFFGGTLRHISVWDAALSAANALQLYNDGSPPDLTETPPAANLVGWWILDDQDTTGAGGIIDHSTGGHNATAAGGLAPTPVEGNLAVRGAGEWETLSPGSAGLALCSNGPGAMPSYQVPSFPQNPFSPTFFEDFAGGAESAAGVASGILGNTGWSANFTGTAGTVQRLVAAQRSQSPGIYRVTAGGTNGNQQALFMGLVSATPVIDFREIDFIEFLYYAQWTAGQAMEIRCGVGSDVLAASSGNEFVGFSQCPNVFGDATTFIAQSGGINEGVATGLPSNNGSAIAFRLRLGWNATTSRFVWQVQRTASEILSGTHPTAARAPSGLGNPFIMTVTQGGTKLVDLDYCSIKVFPLTRGLS